MKANQARGSGQDSELTLEFMQVLWVLDESLERLSRQMKTKIGVTGPQRMVIRLINQTPGLTAKDLAQTLHLHASTISGIVRRLESESFLIRIPNLRDGRSWFLQLTEAGNHIAAEETGTVESAVRGMIGSIARKDVERTKQVLEQLSRKLFEEAKFSSL